MMSRLALDRLQKVSNGQGQVSLSCLLKYAEPSCFPSGAEWFKSEVFDHLGRTAG